MERFSRALELARGNRSGSIDPDRNVRPDGFDPFKPATVTLAADPELLSSRHVLSPSAGGPHAAPYKLLRTQVLQRLDQLGVNTLAVIGAQEGHGASLTATNLAIAIAADHGRRAVLVDLNLRTPGIHTLLGIAPPVGLDTCLPDARPVAEATVALEGYEDLIVLPTLAPIVHSSELLSSRVVADLVQDLQEHTRDCIAVFDLPPALAADDVLAFSRIVSTGLLVVSEGSTLRDDISKTIELLGEMTLIGTVLNASREPVRSR